MSYSGKVSQMLLLGSCLFMNVSLAAASCAPSDCSALGYTKSKSDCGSAGGIQCPFDSTKYYCPSCSSGSDTQGAVPCTPGTILFSNWKCYKADDAVKLNYVPDEVPIAMVVRGAGDVKGQNGLAAALGFSLDSVSNSESNCVLKFLESATSISTSCSTIHGCLGGRSNFSGKINSFINFTMNRGAANCKSGEAAERANAYKTKGTETSSKEWFLPTMKELKYLSQLTGSYDNFRKSFCATREVCEAIPLENREEYDSCVEYYSTICGTDCTAGPSCEFFSISNAGKIWSSVPHDNDTTWVWDTSRSDCWNEGSASCYLSNTGNKSEYVRVLPFIEVP